jgi:gliding motility-associated-like protein
VTLDAAGTVNGTPLSVTPNNTTTYTLVDVTDSNNCTASANGNIIIVVNPLPTVTMSGSTSICDGQSTALDFNFTGTGPYNINYDINSTNTSAVLSNNIDSIVVSPSATTTYNLINVTDAYCSNTASGTVIITVNPLPSATISGGGIICADGSTAQIDIIANGSAPFNVVYSDGFNNVALNGTSSPYNFQTNTAGAYTLNSITDVNGCAGNVSGVAIVVVNPLPIASFSFFPQPADINNPTVYFTDLSSGHVAGIYDFGDGVTEPTILGGQLSHTYLDTGSYQVLYSVTSIDGCITSVSHTVIIDPAFLIYIPTAFTPNRDGKNDLFIPIMMGVGEYNFYIYDRFGGLIFGTTDQLKGWNGKLNENDFALAGHYAYAIKIVDLLGKKRTFAGTVTLIR